MSDLIERQKIDVDIVCVGFGPSAGGFLTTLSREIMDSDGNIKLESRVTPGMPLQVICYERADDLGFGVSGVVTRARGIKKSFPDLDLTQIPFAHEVAHEELLYLLDPIGASRRPALLKLKDKFIKLLSRNFSFSLPWIPPFLSKEPGLVLSVGQFNQWVAGQIMASGLVQIWPGTPVKEALIDEKKVNGVRLVDQGVEKNGMPSSAFMPGMDVGASLTVIADGPVGQVSRQIDRVIGMPEEHHKREWAVGMKMVIDLPSDNSLKPGTVIHTFGFPEPEIFGFMYVYPGNVTSLGIFVPSFFESPVRTSYRYLQYWMKHPKIWSMISGGSIRSWGAKSLDESGKHGEPYLVGDGYARIGENSGTTNVLAGSGVDEAWTSGVLLAESVIELWRAGAEMTKENLEKAYVERRRKSWLESEARVAENSRNGFDYGFIPGFIGMGLSGMTNGILNMPGRFRRPYERVGNIEEYYRGKILGETIRKIRAESEREGAALNGAILNNSGWPEIEYDGKLLVSHQDALLLGGKVQAAEGYSDHVIFPYPEICKSCRAKLCIEICSAQAIMPGEEGVPKFDREKCIHCGACFWNCTKANPTNKEETAMEFNAGSGGLHSAEN